MEESSFQVRKQQMQEELMKHMAGTLGYMKPRAVRKPTKQHEFLDVPVPMNASEQGNHNAACTAHALDALDIDSEDFEEELLLTCQSLLLCLPPRLWTLARISPPVLVDFSLAN